jgi:signal-transduction protein with cAMP-binding, CBS, and nucleotidyltransferase domain
MNATLNETSRLSTIFVAEAMHRGVIACPPDTPLSTVAEVMVAERVHCVVVSDNDGEHGVWGIISDLDLVAAAGVRALEEQSAGGSAASPIVTISPKETLQRAAQLMTEYTTAHLIVVADGRPAGVLSTLDIARAIATRGS